MILRQTDYNKGAANNADITYG